MLYKKEIQQLSILGSSICNLNCDYCYLHNRKTQNFYKLLNEEIQISWINKSYVNNIKKVYEKINADPKGTYRLEIWGGEPLVQIDNLLISLKELLEFLPNITFFMIPTNFAWSENIAKKIIEIIKYYDDTRNPYLSQDAEFHIQMSIDGLNGKIHSEGHYGNIEQYKKNVENIVKNLSTVKLKKVKVIFEFHATASGKNILTQLSDEKNIKEYFDNMYNLFNFFRECIKKYDVNNSCVCGDQAIFPLCAVPENASFQEGTQYTGITRMAEKVFYENKYLDAIGEHPYYSYNHNFVPMDISRQCNECAESGDNALLILPDGTISECACSYVQNREEYLDALIQNSYYDEYRVSLMRKIYFFNPITATEKDIQFNDWYNLRGLRNTYSTQINLAMSLCQELALSRQIPFKYALNKELLLKHLSLETTPYSCTREQLRDTRIPYLSHPGDYRRVLNGGTDYTSEERIAELKALVKKEFMDDKYN